MDVLFTKTLNQTFLSTLVFVRVLLFHTHVKQ